MPFKCCVPHCTLNKSPLHKFPADEQLMKLWCTVIKREDLLRKEKNVVRKSYRVCDGHFIEEVKFATFHNRTNLKVGSVPSIHLPCTTSPVPQEIHEPIEDKPVAGPSTRPDAVPQEIHKQVEDKPVAGPSTRPDTVPQEIQQPMEKKPVAGPSTRPDSPFEDPLEVGAADSKKRKLVQQTGKREILSKMKGNILRKRRNLLLEVKLRKQAQLTPKAAKLYEIAKEYKGVAQSLHHTMCKNKERIEAAISAAESGAIFQEKVNPSTYKFLKSQISQQRKSPRGRRFTDDDKLLSLALLKQGPKNYKLLRKIFALPSRKTLMAMLAKLPFGCGVNEPIFQSLKESVKNLKPRDRHCVLMLDEMSLQPSVSYNKSKQKMEGFQDTGSGGGIPKIADHAMVFMIKGIAKKWKQPICYYFSQNGMSNTEIAKNLKIVLRRLMDMGLKVDVTVCDQYNKAAINMLVEETKRELGKKGVEHETYTFFVDEQEIFPLFDFPHLLKGIRNNMLKYDVRFQWKGETPEVATWRHIEQLYNIDFHEEDDFRMLNRLTEEHVCKHKIKKMKVKNAAQVFSHRVQSTMRALVKHGKEEILPSEAIGTANFLLFMDKLFDSVNASSVQPQDGKILRRAVTKTTNHVEFWDEALKVLRSVKFFSKKKEFVPPTVTNWIISLKNLKLIWSKLQNEGFEFLLTRNLNQDPLENFFSCIRSHGVRNINPSCSAFTSAFKTLIINNFMASHSVNANCEEDQSEGVLNSLKNFLDTHVSEEEEAIPLDYGQQRLIELKTTSSPLQLNLHGYLSGYMAKKILQSIGVCAICRKELITQENAEEHQLITMREYKADALLRPRTKFIVLFNLCVQVVHHWLPILCNETNLRTKLFLIIAANIDSSIFGTCSDHNLYKTFVNMFIDFYCFTWADNVNKILKGSQTKNINDVIKTQALKIQQKNKAKSSKVRLVKQLV